MPSGFDVTISFHSFLTSAATNCSIVTSIFEADFSLAGGGPTLRLTNATFAIAGGGTTLPWIGFLLFLEDAHHCAFLFLPVVLSLL